MANTFTPAAAQAPVANTNAVCTMATPSTKGQRWRVHNIRFGYSATPTGGQLQIAWSDPNGSYTETYPITTGGSYYLPINDRKFPIDQAVTITLAAGGAGVSGFVYVDADTGNQSQKARDFDGLPS